MHLLEKIYYSRKTLRELLDNEWTVDTIQDLSLKELEIMYTNQKNEWFIR